MTILRTLSENEMKEDTKMGIYINEFYLRYHYEGKEHEIHIYDLKDFFSIYLVGLNDE